MSYGFLVKLKWELWINKASAFKANYFESRTNKRHKVQGFGTSINEPTRVKHFSDLTHKYYTRLGRLARDKHSSFLRKSKKYVCKKFYDTGPRILYINNNISVDWPSCYWHIWCIFLYTSTYLDFTKILKYLWTGWPAGANSIKLFIAIIYGFS